MTEWSEVLLGDLCDFSNGANFTKDSFGPGLKIIGVGDFGDRLRPEWETVGEVLPTAVPSDRAMLEAGDIVIVRSNGNRMLVGRSMAIDFLRRNPFSVYDSCVWTRIEYCPGSSAIRCVTFIVQAGWALRAAPT